MLAQVRAALTWVRLVVLERAKGGGMDVRTVKDLCQRLDELGTILELMEGEPINGCSISRGIRRAEPSPL